MFENTKDFERVVVSGPQRSGTRIVAKAIAYDTSKTFIDEADINYHDFRLLQWYLMQTNVVIQCPGLCHKLHEISLNSTLIVMVKRPIDEIINSQNRIKWLDEANKLELAKYGYSSGIISRIKYEYWNRYQKQILGQSGAEVRYHDLEGHPLFIPSELRATFRHDQTV